MYCAHFGFKEDPFGVTPNPRFFYRTAQHHEAVATLTYAIQARRGFALLVGSPGVGKTSILFTVAQAFKGSAQIAYLANPYYDRATVLEAILAAFGLEPAGSSAANHRLFYNFLIKSRQAGKNCIVILDEAQDLDRDTLEAIRMLSNFETPDGKLVQIVLAGQPRLAETLKQPDCEQLRQRLNAVTYVTPLGPTEVATYLTHRMTIAGGAANVFTPGAIKAMTEASGGVPRNINAIAFGALSIAYALKHRQVEPEDVCEASRDLLLPFALAKPEQSSTLPTAAAITFAQTRGSRIPAWIAGGLALLFAAVALLIRFSPPR
jgi:general secretion pathway protein A